MSLLISPEVLAETTHKAFERDRSYLENRHHDNDTAVDASTLSSDALRDLIAAATKADDSKLARAAEAMLAARAGAFDKPIPNFNAFQDILTSFVKQGIIDGWIYVTHDDGRLYPELVTEVKFDPGNRQRGRETPSVTMKTTYYGPSRYSDDRERHKLAVRNTSHTFTPQDVARRRIADVLGNAGIYKETAALKAEHVAAMRHYRDVTSKGFAQQFRINGAVAYYEGDNRWERRGLEVANRKAIHDLEPGDYGAMSNFVESELFAGHAEHPDVGEIPEHPQLRVFDLKTHDFFWVHTECMTPYVYDKSLRDKLILPKSHRDLLDVLTTNLDAFVDDIIEGKSAGNVILGKGVPGVGKTLTAEVYAELIERPLYAIHSGSLGTSATEIEKNLQMIFQRSKRWECVLLLDEADVFVVQRGDNIEQNAIVAEFLRTLEYFDGLLFMTTNRPDDIDDAIISRCAAIIGYHPPPPEDAVAIWNVMASQFKTTLAPELVRHLVGLFPEIAPRDIKMLLRLALRVAAGQKEELSIEVFRRCAMFRAITMKADEA